MFFNKNKHKTNLEEEEKDICIKESEDVSLKHRLNCLMNMPMLGAASIIEIKAIQNRLDELSEEKDYSKWFRNNEPIEIAKRCEEFFFKGYSFNVALEKAKEELDKEKTKLKETLSKINQRRISERENTYKIIIEKM